MIPAQEAAGESAMMGRQDRDQGAAFYEFSLDEMIPAADHLLERINAFATAVLADLHQHLKAFYSEISRRSVNPELMIGCSWSAFAMSGGCARKWRCTLPIAEHA